MERSNEFNESAQRHPSWSTRAKLIGQVCQTGHIGAACADSKRVPRYACGMIRQKRNLVLICVASGVTLFGILFLPGALLAQQAATSPVSIRVTEPTGMGVAHAVIRIVPSPDPTPAKMETDEKGQLALELKTGGYALFVSAPGFKSVAMHIEVLGTKEVQAVPVRLEIGAMGSPIVYPASMKDDLQISAYPYHEDVFLKPAELKAMPRTTITVHNEHSKADETYSGVRLADLLAKMGAPLGKELRGIGLSSYLFAMGSDGYGAVIALAEVDPSFHSGEVIVADTMNGQPLDAKSGPFKLVVTEDKRPARWVRNLVYIQLKSAN
jgi:hypothetical protein